tara:strand:+ start:12347 stop:14092 length:1746 start_codon:yes stop_codon:yes gene_type:complete
MTYNSQKGFIGLVPHLRQHKSNLIIGSLSIFIYVICWPLLAWQAGELIPAIGDGDLNKVLKVISISLLIFFIQKIAQFIQDISLANPALKISQQLRERLFTKLQRIQLNSLDKMSSGDITYRLTEDADRVGEVIYKSIQDTFPCILQLIAIFIYMIILDWHLSIATLVLAPVVAVLVGNFGQRVMNAAEKSQQKVSDLAGLLTETIQGLPLVRAYAAEDWIQQRFKKEVEYHRNARFKTLKLLALQHPIVGFIEVSGILAILLLGALRIANDGITTSEFSSYIAALLMLIDPISHLTTNFNELKQGQASLKRLTDIEKEHEETADVVNPEYIKDPKGDLVLNKINFGYQIGKTVINNLSLKIKAGKVVALVGPSGAGKSTIFSLILRFIRPLNGEVIFDGHEISKLTAKQLRTLIAIVPQRVSIFSGKVSEAISFGRNLSKKQIIKAATIANAHEFITEMSDGYETRLHERGMNLSGGQLQRIAIARAIAGNPAILLLDEATSALDAESEEAVQIGLKQAMKGRTVLVIAHKLSTVQEADLIVVLEKGEICDKGTHEELFIREGLYSELCSKQLLKRAFNS